MKLTLGNSNNSYNLQASMLHRSPLIAKTTIIVEHRLIARSVFPSSLTAFYSRWSFVTLSDSLRMCDFLHFLMIARDLFTARLSYFVTHTTNSPLLLSYAFCPFFFIAQIIQYLFAVVILSEISLVGIIFIHTTKDKL